ncbi:MAG: hypothetical protein ACXVA9_02240 [Bdellovibrionales bacterium]
MDFERTLIKPSGKIHDAIESGRAKLLSVLLIGRGVGLIAIAIMLSVSEFTGLESVNQALYSGVVVNLLAYGISRTRHFRLAAYIIILETMIAVPVVVYRLPMPDVIAAAPYWMTFGTLISSLILPVRQTILFTLLSVLSFFFMSLVVPETSLPALGAALVYFGLSSLLAAIGTAMRDNMEKVHARERRGPPAAYRPERKLSDKSKAG